MKYGVFANLLWKGNVWYRLHPGELWISTYASIVYKETHRRATLSLFVWLRLFMSLMSEICSCLCSHPRLRWLGQSLNFSNNCHLDGSKSLIQQVGCKRNLTPHAVFPAVNSKLNRGIKTQYSSFYETIIHRLLQPTVQSRFQHSINGNKTNRDYFKSSTLFIWKYNLKTRIIKADCSFTHYKHVHSQYRL